MPLLCKLIQHKVNITLIPKANESTRNKKQKLYFSIFQEIECKLF